MMKNNKGYTLLFSVLTAALVLGVASFILGFAKKQAILASTAKESMYAIYAADSGMECILKYVAAISSAISSSSPASISCSGQVLNVTNSTLVPGGDSNWKYAFMSLGDTCVQISVFTGRSSDNKPYTRYESRGYNKCKTDLSGKWQYDELFPRIVERGIQVTDRGIW